MKNNAASGISLSVLDPIVQLLTPDLCTGKGKKTLCVQQVDRALFQVIEDMGFQSVRCIRWVNNTVENLATSYSQHSSNIPSAWLQHYNQTELVKIDPVVRVTATDDETIAMSHGTWSQARRMALKHPLGTSAAEKQRYKRAVDKLFKQSLEHGLEGGLFAKLGGANRQIQISIVTGNPNIEQDLNDWTWHILITLLTILDRLMDRFQACSKCATGIMKSGGGYIELTSAERRLLRLFLYNRKARLEDISEKYKSSRDTINFHLRNVRDKFEQPGVSGHMLAQFANEHRLI